MKVQKIQGYINSYIPSMVMSKKMKLTHLTDYFCMCLSANSKACRTVPIIMPAMICTNGFFLEQGQLCNHLKTVVHEKISKTNVNCIIITHKYTTGWGVLSYTAAENYDLSFCTQVYYHTKLD